MNRNIHDQFLDYLEGNLSENQRADIEALLQSDEELRRDFEAYKKVISVEQSIADEVHPLGPQFSVKVMDRLEEERFGFIQRLSMSWSEHKRKITSSLALVVTAGFVLVLARKIPEENYRLSSKQAAPESAPVPRENVPALQAKTEEVLSQESQPLADSKLSDAETRIDAVRKALDSGSNAKDKENLAPKEKREAEGKSSSAEEGQLAGSAQAGKRSLDKFDGNRQAAEKDGVAAPVNAIAPMPPEAKKALSGVANGYAAPSIDERSFSGNEVSGNGGRKQGGLEEQSLKSKPQRAREALDVAGSYSRLESQDFESRRQATGGRNVPAPAKGVTQSAADFLQAEPAADPAQKRVQQTGMIRPPMPEPLPRYPVAPQYPVATSPADDVDNYKGYEEQPRIRTADEALSTFSVDVDTASYANARRFLMAGNFPPQQSVRIEEFINYFDFNYPSQSEKPFSLTYEIAPSPLEKDRLFLRLGIRARDAKSENKPWNLVFLIDTSGSMSPPERLELIKKGLHVLVSKMRPEDKVSIVTYAGSAGLALDATSAKESAKILAAIDALGSGGSTNGAGGIELAYQVAERNKIANGVNRVILATDGDFNVGITSETQLNSFIEEKRKSGITLTTLGVGTSNFKDARLEQLADKGNGNYFYLDSFQEARHVLGDKIAGTVEVVAKDVKLQVEFNPQHVAQYRLIGYDNRKLNKEDFNNDAIDAGEIGVGHTVTAIYEIILTNTELARRLNTDYRYKQAEPAKTVVSEDMASELAFLKIRYKEPEANVSSLLEFPIESAKVQTSVESTSADFRFASAVAYFGTLLRGSKFSGNYSYHDIADLAEKAMGEDPSGQRREFLNLVKNADARSK